MAGYTKLFGSILDSTVWSEPLATRVVWITMLAMCDQDGNVAARAPGIAKRAGVTRAECDRALATFAAPDPDSRTPDNDGRRATETADGWHILNYERYRDMASAAEKAEKNAERQRRWRERQAKRNAPVTHRNAPLHDVTRITHSEASATPEASTALAGRVPVPGKWNEHSVINLWGDATGTGPIPSPKNRDAAKRLIAGQSRSDIEAAIATAKADGWPRDNGANLEHLENHFARYLAKAKAPGAPAAKPGAERRAALREQRDRTTDPDERARLTREIAESQLADGIGAVVQ